MQFDWKAVKKWYYMDWGEKYATLERGTGLHSNFEDRKQMHVALMQSPTMSVEIKKAIAERDGEEFEVPEWYQEDENSNPLEYWKGKPIIAVNRVAARRVRDKIRGGKWKDVTLYRHGDGWGIVCVGTKVELDLDQVIEDFNEWERERNDISTDDDPIDDGDSVHSGDASAEEVSPNGSDEESGVRSESERDD